MKVAINQTPVDGPWGGGNRFLEALVVALHKAGHSVVHDLRSNDVDVILILDPRTRSPNTAFGVGSILNYLVCENRQAVVVHRINECDERKGTKLMNFRLRLANYAADHTVFIASWLEALAVWRLESERSVILNGGDPGIFNDNGYVPWNGREPLRLVTHHWGANWMKGFDVYCALNRMIGTTEWRDKVAFTYIGNVPAGIELAHTRVLSPLNGAELADELRRHHVYLTASMNEPAGMHHIEGALCGLPLIYRESGALPEYCNGFGESFAGPDEFGAAFTRMLQNYDTHLKRLTGYDRTSEKMVNRFVDLFENLYERRASIASRRRLWRNPGVFLANQINF